MVNGLRGKIQPTVKHLTLHSKPQFQNFKLVSPENFNPYRTVEIQDQTARCVPSDLDLHCPQKEYFYRARTRHYG